MSFAVLLFTGRGDTSYCCPLKLPTASYVSVNLLHHAHKSADAATLKILSGKQSSKEMAL